MSEAPALLMEAAKAASDKQAGRIVILDVSKQLVITDHFLICHGNNDRQVKAIANEVEKRLFVDRKVKPARREGQREGRWIILDYLDFVVHVFHREDREYYDLERLWGDAERFDYEDSWEELDEPAAAKAT